MPDNWRIELLNDRHERGAFSSGKAPLDAFLRTQAGQYDRKGIGRTYIAVRPQLSKALGYYTLAASAVAFADLPKVIVKKLPKHPVPSILLGRLAVDNSVRGQGLGSTLLMDALHRRFPSPINSACSPCTFMPSTTVPKPFMLISGSNR